MPGSSQVVPSAPPPDNNDPIFFISEAPPSYDYATAVPDVESPPPYIDTEPRAETRIDVGTLFSTARPRHLDGPPPSYDDVVAPKLYSSIEQGVIETRVNIDAPSNLNSGGAPPIVHCVNVQPQMYPQPPPQVLYRSFVPAQLPWPDGKCPKNIFCPNCNVGSYLFIYY
uniref:LITAF domain-containing protein n=1 Tax=Rhabditophanes sp. KR3021 TaxID=114890 RepID=A0AC35U090_9BILA